MMLGIASLKNKPVLTLPLERFGVLQQNLAVLSADPLEPILTLGDRQLVPAGWNNCL